MNQQDSADKKFFIEAFFEDLKNRAAFTQELEDSGHDNEARLLCCCYIEGLGNWLYQPNTSTAQNFVTALRDHGGEPTLALILPPRLDRALPYKSASQAIASAVHLTLQSLPLHEALTEAELMAKVGLLIGTDGQKFLSDNLWRGTVANIVYERIRGGGVHWLGSPDTVSFSITKHNGASLPEVDYYMLKAALDRVLVYARTISLETGKWFGTEWCAA
jgi:hypothetical protein